MSFLKNIFQTKKQEPQELGNEVPLILRKGNSTFPTTVKIRNTQTPTPSKKDASLELTTEEILSDPNLKKFIANKYQNVDSTSFSLAIYDEVNDPYTYIKLKPNSKPYLLLNKTEKKLYLIENIRKPKSKAVDMSSNYFTIKQQLQKKKNKAATKKDKVFSGELYTLNEEAQEFNKKQIELTEEKIIISPNGKGRILNIDDIKEIRYDTNSIPKPTLEMMKDKKHVINIKFNEGYSSIYYTKKNSELDKWKKHFEHVLQNHKEKQKDLKLTNTINTINQSIATAFENLHNYLIDNYVYNENIKKNINNNNQQLECLNNRFYTDTIDDIILYKDSIIGNKSNWNAWSMLKKLDTQTKQYSEGGQDGQSKSFSIMSNETKERYDKLLKQTDEIVATNNQNNLQDVFGNIGHLLPLNLFDEIYFTIKKHILKDMILIIMQNGNNTKGENDDDVNIKNKKEDVINKLAYLDVYSFLCVHIYNYNLFGDVRIDTNGNA